MCDNISPSEALIIVLPIWFVRVSILNTLRPRQNGRHLAYDISKRIFLNENGLILSKISQKFVSESPTNNN